MIRSLTLLGLVLLLVQACQTPNPEQGEDFSEEEKYTKLERIEAALEEEFRRTYDPNLGYIPKERLKVAIDQTRRIQQELASRRSANANEVRFVEHGPTNVGGRTRAILIDEADPDRTRILAGSVSGGLFITDDISANSPNWRVVDDYMQNLAVSALAQDPQQPNVIYMGTGEGFSNFDAVRGVGIFKSVDGGETWSILPSTENQVFYYTRSLLVHPETGHVYAATRSGGVRRSEDGGETWTKVLGIGLAASNDDTYDIVYAGGVLYASNSNNIYRSETGERGFWQEITLPGSGFPSNWNRCEFDVCQADPQVMFAVGSIGGSGSNVFRTIDGGANWVDVGSPSNGGDFTNGQAWYDLEITIDPFDCSHTIVGGVPIFVTRNGGSSWSRFANNMHVDQHKCVFDPKLKDVVYFGNDGGVYRSTNGSASFIGSVNEGYITTQYYAGAIHPEPLSNYLLGGTQDNGTHVLMDEPPATGRNVWGGDGFLCFIDEIDPNIQIVSSQFGNWGLSTNGGQSFGGGQNTAGNFLTPADYDSETKILYAQSRNANFIRWNVITSEADPVSFIGPFGGISAITVDRNVPNRVYFGTFSGQVLRVDSANVGEAVESVMILNSSGTVSSIDIANGNPDDILVTYSNYGINNSVMVTDNGGESWEQVEGNLPDMPVRWGIFNPKDPSAAMIATETGVWTTEQLLGGGTVWTPPTPGVGTPIVRTDMLRMRQSDFVVLAATHGRGLWTSSFFSEPTARFDAPQVHYVDVPLEFRGEVSLNAQSYAWDFGDGTTSAAVNPIKTYSEIGEYEVTLTINGNLSTTASVKILPKMGLPYTPDEPDYGGSFEEFDEQYGSETLGGSAFEVGLSSIAGKQGAKTGSKAMVLGPNETFYKNFTNSAFYTPAFDFSEENIYTLSFWANYSIHPGPDGFLVQYSTDQVNWQTLGTKENGWYNFDNTGVSNSAFPTGTSYFTSIIGGYTQYSQNVSFLSGNSTVAFRFVFRSEGTGSYSGVAFDDIVVTKFEGAPETRLVLGSFMGVFDGNTDVDLSWTTEPEYYCRKIEIERSINGRDFNKVGELNCRGFVSATRNTYSFTDQGGRNLYFYRLRVINENDPTNYSYEFYSPTITVRRNLDGIEPLIIFPNPFTNQINVTFSEVVNENVRFELYDNNGRLIFENESVIDNVFFSWDVPQTPMGTYFLSIQIGDNDPDVYPMIGGGSN